MVTDLESLPWMQLEKRERDAGVTIGSWIWTYRNFSIVLIESF